MGRIILEVGALTVEQTFDDALFQARVGELIAAYPHKVPANATPRQKALWVLRWMWWQVLKEAADYTAKTAAHAERRRILLERQTELGEDEQ